MDEFCAILDRDTAKIAALLFTVIQVNRCFGRKQVLPKISMKKLNQKLSVIMHAVVHPKYRTIGLGSKLVMKL